MTHVRYVKCRHVRLRDVRNVSNDRWTENRSCFHTWRSHQHFKLNVSKTKLSLAVLPSHLHLSRSVTSGQATSLARRLDSSGSLSSNINPSAISLTFPGHRHRFPPTPALPAWPRWPPHFQDSCSGPRTGHPVSTLISSIPFSTEKLDDFKREDLIVLVPAENGLPTLWSQI